MDKGARKFMKANISAFWDSLYVRQIIFASKKITKVRGRFLRIICFATDVRFDNK